VHQDRRIVEPEANTDADPELFISIPSFFKSTPVSE